MSEICKQETITISKIILILAVVLISSVLISYGEKYSPNHSEIIDGGFEVITDSKWDLLRDELIKKYGHDYVGWHIKLRDCMKEPCVNYLSWHIYGKKKKDIW